MSGLPSKETIKRMQIDIERAERRISQHDNPTVLGAWMVFADEGMVWLCNRVLKLFGWRVILHISREGELLTVCPKRLPDHKGPSVDRLMKVPGMLLEFLRDHLNEITQELS